jgi:hypothetical protein
MPPYWFVFDLDETLTHMNPYFATICSFFTDEVAIEAGAPLLAVARPAALDGPLQTAYENFVRAVAAEELGTTPLGVVRPGVIELFREIARLKDAGLAGGAFIYSNNGTMRVLKFVADVIHEALGRRDLICDYSHLRDPRRAPEKPKNPMESLPKLFRRIQEIIRTGPCGPVAAPAPEPKDVFFFDDIMHNDIFSAIRDNYIQVLPYRYKVNTDRFATLYFNALTEAGVLTDDALRSEFFKFTRLACFPGLQPGNAVNTFRPIFRGKMKSKNLYNPNPYGDPNPPVNDGSLNAITARLQAMGPPANNGLGNNPLNAIQINNGNNGLGNNPLNAIQVAGRRRRRSAKTKKANRKNRRNNRTKWRRQ